MQYSMSFWILIFLSNKNIVLKEQKAGFWFTHTKKLLTMHISGVALSKKVHENQAVQNFIFIKKLNCKRINFFWKINYYHSHQL